MHHITYKTDKITFPSQKVCPPQFLEIIHQLKRMPNNTGSNDDCTTRQ